MHIYRRPTYSFVKGCWWWVAQSRNYYDFQSIQSECVYVRYLFSYYLFKNICDSCGRRVRYTNKIITILNWCVLCAAYAELIIVDEFIMEICMNEYFI